MKMLVVASSQEELEGLHVPYRQVVGVGKVQSALLTNLAIEREKPDWVVCVGSARALDPSLHIGDIVCADSVWQHDVDLTRFGLKVGELPNGTGGVLGSLSVKPVKGIRAGRCASGDVFVTRPYQESHPVLSTSLFCDMESYGVALSAAYHQLPCSIIRVISDDVSGHRAKNYRTLIRNANKQLDLVLSQLSE